MYDVERRLTNDPRNLVMSGDGRHGSCEASPLIASGGSLAVDPVFGFDFDLDVGIAVFDVDTDAAAILRVEELLESRVIFKGLKLAEGLNEVLCERSRVGRVLLHLFPADRRGTRRRDEKVLLDLGWLEIAGMGDVGSFALWDQGVGICTVHAQHDLGAEKIVSSKFANRV